MTARPPMESDTTAQKWRSEPIFTEAGAWQAIGAGWQPLHGNFRDSGYSVEWHDFDTERDLDWSRSFHPRGVEICLNLAGRGEVRAGNRQLELAPSTAGFYLQNETRLTGMRAGGERHLFVTVELSFEFLDRHVNAGEKGLHPRLKNLLNDHESVQPAVSDSVRLTSEHQQLVMSLRRPPVYAGAHRMWYQAKALEVAAALFYRPSPQEEFFCQRQNRLNVERVQNVIAVLKHNLAEPLPLEEIGRRVGCSHFYLSRTFTQVMGRTISAYLRQLRMERAAELLREGKLNVTQVALEVGYSSPSHFSTAFHATFGCCPGLYPLKTLSQRAGLEALK